MRQEIQNKWNWGMVMHTCGVALPGCNASHSFIQPGTRVNIPNSSLRSISLFGLRQCHTPATYHIQPSSNVHGVMSKWLSKEHPENTDRQVNTWQTRSHTESLATESFTSCVVRPHMTYSYFARWKRERLKHPLTSEKWAETAVCLLQALPCDSASAWTFTQTFRDVSVWKRKSP